MKVGTYSTRWGNYVRNQRCRRRLTAKGLAEKAKLDQSYISLMQRGYVPSLGVVERLADALELNPDEARLMAGFGPRNPTRILKLVQRLEVEDGLTDALRQEIEVEDGLTDALRQEIAECSRLPQEAQDEAARVLRVWRNVR